MSMGRNITSILIAFIAGLAIVGFLTMLIKNPGSLLISILLMIGVAFFIFIIMRAVLTRLSKRRGSSVISKLLKIGVAFDSVISMRAVLNRVGQKSGENSKEMKKYRKAVKESKQKYNPRPKTVNTHRQ